MYIGCAPGGATYHRDGCDYMVIMYIFTKKAISPRVFWGFHFNLYTMFTRNSVYRVCSRWRHLSYLRFHERFKFSSHTLRQTLFLLNHVGDLTQIHKQCPYGLCHLRVCSRTDWWRHLSRLWLHHHHHVHFHEKHYFS